MRRTIASLAVVPVALACSCREATVCVLIQAPVLFIGEVIAGGVNSIRDDPWYAGHVTSVRFRVIEAFRGVEQSATVDVRLHLWKGMCAPIPYFPGRKYLVRPTRQEDGSLRDGLCFTGEDIADDEDRVRFVRDWFAGRIPLNVHGSVASFESDELGPYRISTGQAKLLSGSRVIAQRGGTAIETITDPHGRYFLALPSPGPYTVRAVLNSYISLPDRTIEVPAKGCAVRDLGVYANNSIEGRVTGSDGNPVGAEVHLLDADAPGTKAILVAGSDKDGRYRFQRPRDHVPNGRFRVAVNPVQPLGTSRYEPSFHPRVIEIRDGNTDVAGVDIVVGRLIGFRRIRAKVTFRDGTPMNHAVVSATFAAKPLWNYGTGVREGAAEFHAPSELPLRLTVRDAYGRDLGAKYEAEFPADWKPIEHRFVIQQ